jgi:hypothetical protein
MRIVVVFLLVGALLTGCVGLPANPSPTRGSTGSTPSVEASSGADIPANDPTLPQTDDAGMTPYGVVNRLVGAVGGHDWKTWYSMFSTPTVDYAVAKAEATQADEDYQDFNVLEVRITDEDSAYVRVSYRAQTTPSDGDPYDVSVPYPGEWWPLHKVHGVWKVQWMPRQ